MHVMEETLVSPTCLFGMSLQRKARRDAFRGYYGLGSRTLPCVRVYSLLDVVVADNDAFILWEQFTYALRGTRFT